MNAQFPDDAVIPARAEGLLALRWHNLCKREGHAGKPPTNETLTAQAAGRIKAGKFPKHHNTLRSARNRKIVLDALKRGLSTVAEIAQETDVSIETIRKAIRDLAQEGVIEVIGKEQVSGGQGNIWAIKK